MRVVTNTNTSGAGSLAEAVQVAAPGDSIVFSDGVAGTINFNRTFGLTIDKRVIVAGPGADKIVIRGGGEGQVATISISGEGALNLSGVAVSGHLGSTDGGAFAVVGARLELTDVVIRDNEAARGAAIYNQGGSIVIGTSTLRNNVSREIHGGAIYNSGFLFVSETTIRNNASVAEGGGIYNSGTAQIVRSTISHNEAGLVGGGLANVGRLLLQLSTLAGNRSHARGGGASTDSLFSARMSTIAHNSSVDGTGGIYVGSGGTLSIESTLIADNVTESTAAEPPLNCEGTGDVDSGGFNLIANVSGCALTFDETSDHIGTAEDPIEAHLADSLEANGGSTLTIALLEGSPAIDSGKCIGDVDQRGHVRTIGAACDVGAFEFGAPVFTSREAAGEVPETDDLHSNYPNPFSTTTTIPFELSKPSHAMMEVYDLLGRRVEVLADGGYSAGRHEVVFYAADLPSGVYMVRFKAGETLRSRLVTVIE